MIAIAIIAIGLAGVAGSLAYGIENSQRGRELSESNQVAAKLFEYIQGASLLSATGGSWPNSSSGLNDNPDERRDINAAPFGNSSPIFTPYQVDKFKRNIRSQRISVAPNSHEAELAKVTVTIYWEKEGKESKSELTGIVRHGAL